MIEKIVQVGNLFEFYGNLLSDRQYKVVEMFYIDDLSLTEIGELLEITRQGVYDNLKRAEENLFKYEEKLNLYKKFQSGIEDLREITEITNKIKLEIKDKTINDSMDKIDEKVNSILKESWEVEK